MLNGTRPAGPVTERAVDAALAGGASDRALHAAALLLAHRSGGDFRLGRSQPKRWALGLDELIETGHVDAAAAAAAALYAAFPRMPYAEHLALVFRRLPPVADHGRRRFLDDPDRDFQVVPVPGADTVVLAFCGIGHRLGLNLNLIDRWFGQLGAHVVYLRDRRRVGFTEGVPGLGRNLEATLDGVRALARDLGARRVVCTGNSAGGAGALRYARHLDADRVLVLAPITGGSDFVQKITPDLPPGGETPWTDLVPLYQDGTGPSVRVLYGEHNEADREQALRMAGLPNVRVEAIPEWESHHLVGGLLRAGRLQAVLSWLVAEDRAFAPAAASLPTPPAAS